MSENTIHLPPVKVAFILDNVVQDFIHTDERFASILLSEPLVLDLTDVSDDFGNPVQVGEVYDPETKTFGLPQSPEAVDEGSAAAV